MLIELSQIANDVLHANACLNHLSSSFQLKLRGGLGSMSLSFYVNSYFQSDSLKSNSLTSEAKDGCHEVVFGLKMIS